MNIRRIFLKTTIMLGVSSTLACGFSNASAQPNIVYKHTDENGRVTYSNSPIKGATVVELAPLMTMPAAPQITQQNKARAPAEIVMPQAPIAQSPQPASMTTPEVAMNSDSATHTPSTAPSIAAKTLAPPMAVVSTVRNAAVSGGISAATMAQQRREDVRRRILEGEIEAEEQVLQEAANTLAAEQSRSGPIRAFHASLASQSSTSETTRESKALIARHFERVRDLQDQVEMHKQNLAELRDQLSATGQRQQIAQVNPSSKRSTTPYVASTPSQPAKSNELAVVRLKPASNSAPKRSLAEDR